MTEAPWTILRVLEATRDWFAKRGIDSARLDAELIIAHAVGLSRVMLYARFDQPMSEDERARVRVMMQRRGRHEPLAYILGQREFWSLPLTVDARVLIPRPDTEVLVEEALRRLAGLEAPRVVDVGTGSGAVALALAHDVPTAVVEAIDVSEGALAVARANAEALGLAARVTFFQGDLLAARPGPYTQIVANLPYVRRGDIAGLDPDVREHEPHLALDGGLDGLDLVRRLVTEATTRLVPSGTIVLEAGWDQLEAVGEILGAAGFEQVELRRDYAGHLRVAAGVWAGQGSPRDL